MDDVVHVEVAWSTDPLTRPGALDWTRLGTVDASLLVESLTTSRGANVRTGDIETGAATAKIADPSGNLDPSNVLGDWYPNVLPRRRIRFVVDPSGASPEVVLWTGYVKALPIQWRQAVQWTTLTAAGIFWLLADEELPPSVLQVETLALSPVAYWPMTETAGTIAEDVAGVSDGVYSRADLSAVDLAPYASGGKTFAAATMTAGGLTTASGDFAVSVWFSTEMATGLFAHGNGTQSFGISVTSTGVVVAAFDGTTLDSDTAVAANLLDGKPHHLLVTTAIVTGVLLGFRIYVDGQILSEDLGGGLISSGLFLTVNGDTVAAGLDTVVVGDAATTVNIGHVAWWDSDIAGSADDIYDAGVHAWDGDLTGARLERVLDLVGVDATDRDIDTGTQTCGPTLLGGNVMEYVRAIAATEGGPVYEDAEGRICLRESVANDPAIVATFSDDPVADSGDPVAELDPDFSLDRVVNVAKVSRETGVAQEATNATSAATFGPRTLTLSTLHSTPSGARAAAARQTIRNADPRLVFPTVTADSIDATTTNMTGTDIGEAVTIIARPPRGGDPIEQTSIVERVEHKLAGGQSWLTTFGVAEHTVLPDFHWDVAGQGWDESVWVP